MKWIAMRIKRLVCSGDERRKHRQLYTPWLVSPEISHYLHEYPEN